MSSRAGGSSQPNSRGERSSVGLVCAPPSRLAAIISLISLWNLEFYLPGTCGLIPSRDRSLLPAQVATQSSKPRGLFGVRSRPGRRFADKSPDDRREQSEERPQQYYQRPPRPGLAVRLDCLVHHLYYGGVLGLIYLGQFELLGEQLVEEFVVLHVTQTAEIVEASVSRRVPLTDSGNRGRAFDAGKLAPERFQLLLGSLQLRIAFGGEGT